MRSALKARFLGGVAACISAHGGALAPTDARAQGAPIVLPEIGVIATTPLPGAGIAREKVPAANYVAERRRAPAQRSRQRHRRARDAHRRRQLESSAGQSVPAEPDLSRLRGFPACRKSARARSLRQRRALQPAVRRHRQLGPGPVDRNPPHGAGGIEPGVRPQCARRLDFGRDEERIQLPGRGNGAHGRLVRPDQRLAAIRPPVRQRRCLCSR